MYLLFIAFSLSVAYFLLYFLFSFFFKNSFIPISSKAYRSVFYIIALSIAVSVISDSLVPHALENRVLHALGGGFLSFLVCFLVVKDSGLKIGNFQFLAFSLLVVTGLGVANEILEFFLQNYSHLTFAPNVNDTWWDLISNSVGALIGAIILMPFIKNKC